jgi:glucosyltransferase
VKISCIVPCFNEERVLDEFYVEISRIAGEMPEQDFEFLFIDDGSKDKTLKKIKELRLKDERIHYVSFSRNFGKEAGIFAGLQNMIGDYAVILDADLQDPPFLIPKMYRILTEDEYDCVGTCRVNRKGEPLIRSCFARMFYKLMNKMSKTEVVDGARDFQMMSRKVVDSILSMGEYNRFAKGIFGWIGFKKKWIEYKNVERVAGETKWSFWSLTVYALEGIVAFSTAPLVLSSILGILFCVIAFILIVIIFVKTIAFGDSTSGWPSMVCLMMLVSGVQLFCMGILGQYLAKTYLETKQRPIYLICEAELSDGKSVH